MVVTECTMIFVNIGNVTVDFESLSDKICRWFESDDNAVVIIVVFFVGLFLLCGCAIFHFLFLFFMILTTQDDSY